MNLSSFINLPRKSKFVILEAIVLTVGVGIAVIASQQSQENRSRASVPQQVGYKAVDMIGTGSTEPEVVAGEVLIKLKSTVDQSLPDQVSPDNLTRESLRQLNKAVRVERFERVLERRKEIPLQSQPETAWYKVKATTVPGIPKIINSRRNKAEFDRVLALVEQYKKDPDVEVAEPNYVVHGAVIPNDYFYSTHQFFSGYDDLWGLKRINMSTAWNYSTGNNVLVAVIDSGVDGNNPDLQANMWGSGWNFVSNNNNTNDDFGHGTHVAGILGAVGNNNLNIPGVNWRIRIMAVKVLDNTGNGSLDNIAKGLRYASDNGAKVSNNSYTCPCVSSILNDAVNYEYARGMVVVVAAGNNNTDAMNNSPASSANAITVGATNPYDQRASFSAYGPKIDVVAPGVDILSIVSNVSPFCGVSSGGYNKVCWGSGTSFSTPQVAGLAALMLSKNSSLTNDSIRQIIRNSARDLGPAGRDSDFGYGMIDAGKAMSQVSGNTSPSPAPIQSAPSPTPAPIRPSPRPPTPAPSQSVSKFYYCSNNYPCSHPTLSNGSTGVCVQHLQCYLTAAASFDNNPSYNPGAIDGYFGTNTYNAVISYQGVKGLSQDGIVGPATWGSLHGACQWIAAHGAGQYYCQ